MAGSRGDIRCGFVGREVVEERFCGFEEVKEFAEGPPDHAAEVEVEVLAHVGRGAGLPF